MRDPVLNCTADPKEWAMSHMIGELRFNQAGRPITACLGDDLRWSCEDASYEQLLNDSFGRMDLRVEVTTVHEPIIHGIYQMAERLGAEVRLRDRHLQAV